MARIELKLWSAPLAALSQPAPVGLAEGEIAIDSDTNLIVKRPDGMPNAPLISLSGSNISDPSVFESSTVTVGGATPISSDNGKDTGIQFGWIDDSIQKIGFIGFDKQSKKFVILDNATESGGQFSGAVATLRANIEGTASYAQRLSNPQTITVNGDISGTISFSGDAPVNVTLSRVANDWQVVTSGDTLTNGLKFTPDNRLSQCYYELPANPVDGYYVEWVPSLTGFDVNSMTIRTNGKTVHGVAGDLTVVTPNVGGRLIFRAAENTWQLISVSESGSI